jgi:hypothetical protein
MSGKCERENVRKTDFFGIEKTEFDCLIKFIAIHKINNYFMGEFNPHTFSAFMNPVTILHGLL